MPPDPLAHCSLLQEQLRWWRRIASIACLLAVMLATAAATQHWATWIAVERMRQAKQDQNKAERDRALLVELVEDQRRELQEEQSRYLSLYLRWARQFEDTLVDPVEYSREIKVLQRERNDLGGYGRGGPARPAAD